jgi:hypothetical protein
LALNDLTITTPARTPNDPWESGPSNDELGRYCKTLFQFAAENPLYDDEDGGGHDPSRERADLAARAASMTLRTAVETLLSHMMGIDVSISPPGAIKIDWDTNAVKISLDIECVSRDAPTVTGRYFVYRSYDSGDGDAYEEYVIEQNGVVAVGGLSFPRYRDGGIDGSGIFDLFVSDEAAALSVLYDREVSTLRLKAADNAASAMWPHLDACKDAADPSQYAARLAEEVVKGIHTRIGEQSPVYLAALAAACAKCEPNPSPEGA